MAEIPMWRRYLRLLGPDAAADAREEVRFHLEARTDELVAQGWPREAAEQEAERQFGDVRAIEAAGARLGRERERAVERRDFCGACVQDLRYGLRTLGKERGFTLVTVLILALGIAANTAVFSVVNTVLLRPLPFPRAQELIWMASSRRSAAEGKKLSGMSDVTYTVDALEEYQRNTRAFSQISAYNPFLYDSDYTMLGRGEPQPVAGVMVAENFFPMLGVEPALGRLFSHQEHTTGGAPAVLLSHAYWRSRFNSDRAVLGQTVTLRQRSVSTLVTIAGVMPESFDFGAVFAPGVRIDIYVPAVMDVLRTRGNTLALVGRLKAGVSGPQAQAEADLMWPQIHAAHKDWWGDYTSTLTGLKEHVSGTLRRSLMLLWGAVGLMLLIVSVNLSNLMLARGAARSKEFAVRSALGAGRWRLVQQLLSEGALLAAAGSALGLALAYGLVYYLAHQGSVALPLLSQVRVDGAALAWTMGLTALVAVLFGIVPVIGAPREGLLGAMREGGRGTTAGGASERLRSTLVVAEVALASVLLIGAGLLLRSFLNVLDVELGFQPSRAMVIQVDYDDGRKLERRAVVLEQMVRAAESIPGVEAAGFTDMLPLGRNRSWYFAPKDRALPKSVERGALVRNVTPGYLRAMGMRLRAGRDFDWGDGPTAPRVVIINQAAARTFWQGDDPLGRTAIAGGRETRVVGVLDDVRDHSLEAPPGPEMYLPVMQSFPSGGELVLRSGLGAESLAPAVMKTLRALNPAQPAAELRPLQRIVDRSVSPRRFFVWLVGAFAGLGLLLAALGVYGVISYSVARQRQQIGIRMALGATAGEVLRSVVGRAGRLALAGLALGMLCAAVAGRWIESLLFGTRASDPWTYLAIALLLGVPALLAGYIPARRAAQIDPLVALRSDD